MTNLQFTEDAGVTPAAPLTDSRRPRKRPIWILRQRREDSCLTAPRTMRPKLSAPATWLDGVSQEMQSFRALPPNWDSYGGGPIRPDILNEAMKVAEFLAECGFSRPVVGPQSSGGILMEWDSIGGALTVDLDGNHGFSFAYERPGRPDVEGGIEEFARLLDSGLQPL